MKAAPFRLAVCLLMMIGLCRAAGAEGLNTVVSASFQREPLQNAVQALCEKGGLKHRFDGDALKAQGLTLNMPVTVEIQEKKLNQALRMVLEASVKDRLQFKLTDGGKTVLVSTKEALEQIPPTAADVSYGSHPLNAIDFWKADGDGPRPLMVYIHGGGWVGGDKKRDTAIYKPFLEKGISVAAVNYRLTGEFPLPTPVHDAARAIQFIRSKASEWNINTNRIALTGGSAGACTSMWLLLHDDLADPNSTDPIARQSTRVCAAAVSAGQTSIDPKVIEGWLGPNVLKHRMINMAVGEATMEGALANYAKHEALYKEFSPYNHVDKNDPPLLMTYGGDLTLPSKDAGHGIHHPVYGVKLKEKSDMVGHECHLLIPKTSKSEQYATENEFLFAKLLAP
jgi:arylformamidase